VAPTHLFMVLMALILAGLGAERLSRVLRVPDIALCLAAGVLLGPVLGLVRLSAQGGPAVVLLTFGAAFMLFEGGRRLPLRVLREIWVGLALLSTLGLLITAAVVAVAAHLLLRLPWPEAGLLAAVVSSTDPATIVPLFRAVRIRARLARLLEAESACNDAVAAVLTFALLGLVQQGRTSVPQAAAHLLWMLGGGAGCGVAFGLVASWLLPGGRGLGLFDTREQGAILSLAVVVGAYGLATAAGASGYLAVFLAGVVMGNRHEIALAAPPAHRRLHEAYLGQVGVLVRMLVFLVLGAVVELRLVAAVLLPGLAVSAVLVAVARPATVLASLLPDRRARWTAGEVRFASWVRETGVVPAALAGILLQARVPDAPQIAAAVFIAVLVTILVQPTTTRWWARVSGVGLDGGEGPAEGR